VILFFTYVTCHDNYSHILNGPTVYACTYSQGIGDIVTVGVSIERTDPSTASAANTAQVTTNDGAGCTIIGYFATQAGYNRSFLSTAFLPNNPVQYQNNSVNN